MGDSLAKRLRLNGYGLSLSFLFTNVSVQRSRSVNATHIATQIMRLLAEKLQSKSQLSHFLK